VRPTRRTQPYRKRLSRPASPTLKAMKRGKTLYGQNPADIKRLATKQARRRRLRRA